MSIHPYNLQYNLLGLPQGLLQVGYALKNSPRRGPGYVPIKCLNHLCLLFSTWRSSASKLILDACICDLDLSVNKHSWPQVKVGNRHTSGCSSLFITTDWNRFHITADIATIRLSITALFSPLSLMNKTLRCLDSSTPDPKRAFHPFLTSVGFTLFNFSHLRLKMAKGGKNALS